jgi:hypothetical protein
MNLKKTKGKKGGKDQGIDLAEEDQQTQEARLLMDKMHLAFINDRENFKQGKPSLQKLILAKEVYETLRKINV